MSTVTDLAIVKGFSVEDGFAGGSVELERWADGSCRIPQIRESGSYR